ncbi:MAG: hypothetical protein ACI4FZ_01965 [Lachnospiraceae bacterium]
MRKKLCIFAVLIGIVFMFIGYRMGADIETIAEKLENNIEMFTGAEPLQEEHVEG